MEKKRWRLLILISSLISLLEGEQQQPKQSRPLYSDMVKTMSSNIYFAI